MACLGICQDTTPASPFQENQTVVLVLKPARVFDGAAARAEAGWVVVIRGQKIDQVGPDDKVRVPADAKVINLPGATLLKGLLNQKDGLDEAASVKRLF